MKLFVKQHRYNSEKAIINMTITQPDLSEINDKMVENFKKKIQIMMN